MKKGRLKEIVKELQKASKMHLKQSEEIAEHIDDMKSPANKLSDEGKKINDKFENCGMVFYDTESGIKSFEGVVNDLLTFQEASKRTIRRFQEEIAYPVSKNEFIQKLKGII